MDSRFAYLTEPSKALFYSQLWSIYGAIMCSRPALLKKINLPVLGQVVPRPRLFRLLDQRGSCTVTWISGMAGSGKTTLAASYLAHRNLPCLWYQLDERDADLATFFYYLGKAAYQASPHKRKKLLLFTAEYSRDASTFARRYFEDLERWVGGPFVLVFDDYHSIPGESPLHGVLRDGFAALSRDGHVIMLSRTDPPSVLAGWLARKTLRKLAPQKLQMSVRESERLLRRELSRRMPRALVEQIHARTQGWAAGLVLWAKTLERNGILPENLDGCTSEEIFAYFAGELFARLNRDLQEFLVKTSFLPRITGSMAETLTGQSRAGRQLASLERNHLFIQRHASNPPIYQYHPLFREFLHAKAEDVLTQDQNATVQEQGARLMEEAGYHEDAVDLYAATGQTSALVRLVERHGPTLLEQGRNETVAQWIGQIPDDVLASHPEMDYWLGVCLQHRNPAQARVAFERAFNHYLEQQDWSGILQSWSGIIESIIYEWNCFTHLDPWIEWLEQKQCNGLDYPTPQIETRVTVSMACALMFRRPEAPKMGDWVERALSLARQAGDTRLRTEAWDWTITYYCWLGNFARADILKDETRHWMQTYMKNPAVGLHVQWLEIAAGAFNGIPAPCYLDNISEALQQAQDTGVRLWDHMFLNVGIYIALMLGDLSQAADFLERVRQSLGFSYRHAHSIYHHGMGLYHLLAGDMPRALEHAHTASKIAIETGYVFAVMICRYGLAQILVEQQAYEEAESELSSVLATAVQTESKILEFMVLLALARLGFQRGRNKQGRSYLGRAIHLGRQHNLRNFIWWWQPALMADLLPRALATETETAYVQDMLRLHRVVVSPPPYHIEAWPWALKIHTLGPFAILRNEHLIQTSTRTHKKPLDLLKILIACGGRDVNVMRLQDILWPDSDGDAAHSAFSTTLNRLRTLLGSKDVFTLHHGVLSLDDSCWLDTWAFEDLIARAQTQWQTGDEETAMTSYRAALSLYQNHFLAAEDKCEWIASPRHRLNALWVDAVTRVGYCHENRQEFEEAVSWYGRAIDLDALQERFYQRYMICCHFLDRQTDIERAFRRCRETLRSLLDVNPSSKTIKIYEEACRA